LRPGATKKAKKKRLGGGEKRKKGDQPGGRKGKPERRAKKSRPHPRLKILKTANRRQELGPVKGKKKLSVGCTVVHGREGQGHTTQGLRGKEEWITFDRPWRFKNRKEGTKIQTRPVPRGQKGV